MKVKKLYIIDIRFKQKEFNLSKYKLDEKAEILSLTPYSSYLLDQENIKYFTFHNIKSVDEFNRNAFKDCHKLEELMSQYKNLSYLFYYLVLIRNKQLYYNILFNYFAAMHEYNLIYITDTLPTKHSMKQYDFMSNKISLLHNFTNMYQIIVINKKDNLFYLKQNVKIVLNKLRYTRRVFNKFLQKLFKNKKFPLLSYDNIHLESYLNKQKEVQIQTHPEAILQEYKDFKFHFLNMFTFKNDSISILNQMYDSFFDSLENLFNKTPRKEVTKIFPFVFLSNNYEFLRALTYQQNNIKTFFTQHGSYIYENITLKYCEIYPADMNFVFNEYTKKLFENRGAKEVHVVGSVNFNQPFKNLKKVYDFVYIVFCSSYTYTGTFAGVENANISMDGMNIYRRHQQIIKIFGEIFTDKNLCIKIQPSIMSSSMYVPFFELAQKYPNISIEFTMPLHNIIEQTQYIISDYFSSEFINRELHYKKDIILFSQSPYPIQSEIFNDINEMFILCPDENSLEDIVKNIDLLTVNRKRNDEVIEYYSSKSCKTTELMIDILEEEADGR